MTTKEERQRAVEIALGSTRLEGMEPSEDAIAIMQRFVEGEIGIYEAIDLIKELHGLPT